MDIASISYRVGVDIASIRLEKWRERLQQSEDSRGKEPRDTQRHPIQDKHGWERNKRLRLRLDRESGWPIRDGIVDQ